MALTQEDLETLGGFIEHKIASVIEDRKPAEPTAEEAAQARVSIVGQPDVPADAGPLYWIHLADGGVIQSHDSSSTHVAGKDGAPVLVIGRFQVGG